MDDVPSYCIDYIQIIRNILVMLHYVEVKCVKEIHVGEFIRRHSSDVRIKKLIIGKYLLALILGVQTQHFPDHNVLTGCNSAVRLLFVLTPMACFPFLTAKNVVHEVFIMKVQIL